MSCATERIAIQGEEPRERRPTADVRVKICGITRIDDGKCAADEGADFVGFVFVPESRRAVTPAIAAVIADAIRRHAPGVQLVGVFRDAPADRIEATAREVGLDLVQLHGGETVASHGRLSMPVVRAVAVGDSIPDYAAWESAAWLLFDSRTNRGSGGNGRTFDWSLLERNRPSKRFFLAGGLDADNVERAVATLRPDGVDAATGVEKDPGIKDHAAIRRFITSAKRGLA